MVRAHLEESFFFPFLLLRSSLFLPMYFSLCDLPEPEGVGRLASKMLWLQSCNVLSSSQ